jgi:hypothetical protein
MDTLKLKEKLGNLTDKQKDFVINSLPKSLEDLSVKFTDNPEELMVHIILHQYEFTKEDLEEIGAKYGICDQHAMPIIGNCKIYKLYENDLPSNFYVNLNQYVNDEGEIKQAFSPCDFDSDQVILIQEFYETDKENLSESYLLIYKP